MVAGLLPRYPHLGSGDVRWLLCDAAPAVLPELGPDLGERALHILRERGVQVRLTTELTDIGPDAVTLSDGTRVPTHTVVWTAGVGASPLIGAIADRHHLQVDKGRLTVDSYLAVPGQDHVWALGDAAAVPDLTHPGKICPPTAQHAQRQAKRAAGNVVASLGVGRSRRYKHHDLGLVVDLGARDAVAKPFGLPLAGLAAKTVTRGYHLFALPAGDNRIRVGVDWVLDAALARSAAQLSVIPRRDVTLPATEHDELYRPPANAATSSSRPADTTSDAAHPTG